MPIRVPDNLPSYKELLEEDIFVMKATRAMNQEIRPLEILILNLMPNKSETEGQLLRLLSNSPLQVNVEFLAMKTHTSKNCPSEHLAEFYKSFDEIKNYFYDGLIITGAPVEKMAFEDVDYWDEITQVFDWSKTHVFSTLHICWGAQAGLYYHYDVEKILLDKKLSGIFVHDLKHRDNDITRGYDDVFYAPHSRNTGINRAQVEAVPELEILADSPDAGIFLIGHKDNRAYFATGHLEYDRDTLKKEYKRDEKVGINPEVPANYFAGDDVSSRPKMNWHMAATLLFSNWLNYSVYQNTPYKLSDIENL
ncbi:MAG: homoserine O-succinyltransferase [Lactobacillales bacterium]|jgi:homoserine O-succinyltransferase|nr:homoserine O-succinyltransferase [Lactobacillales bacterium]